MASGTQQRDVTCPRCGYDLSGTTDTWREQCPVEGVCSECGLQAAWRDFFRPDFLTPRWSFEHASGLRRISTFFKTTLRLLQPWFYWRDMPLSAPVRNGGAFVYLGLHTVLVWLIGVCIPISAYIQMWRQGGVAIGWQPSISTSRDVLDHLVAVARWPLGAVWDSWYFADFIDLTWWFIVPPLLLSPLVFLVLGETLRRSKVRIAQIVRVAVYNAAGAMVLYGIWLVVFRWILGWEPGRSWRGFEFLEEWVEAMLVYPAQAYLGVPLVWFAWLFVSWWMACRYYLRLPHACGVALAIVILAHLPLPVVFALGVGFERFVLRGGFP
jgi:hypothetical protein